MIMYLGLVLLILFVIPIGIFLCVKMGTYAYLLAKHKFGQRYKTECEDKPSTITRSGGSSNGYKA